MRWKKLGKIFDPRDHSLLNGYAGFAQSPQALVLTDRIRVYFSIRKSDRNGKFLSHVLYVDFDKLFTNILKVSDKPVIALGELGHFDEHGIFPFSPLTHDGKILAYTCGWSRRRSVSVETATGLAFSVNEGETFSKFGSGPVFGASLHEPCLVGDSFVRFFNNQFHMWYIFGTHWVNFPGEREPDRVYKIAHAISENGIEWLKDSRVIIPDLLDTNECQALPSVVFWKGYYHMVFCYRHADRFRTDPMRGYRLGYATSFDLAHWERKDSQLEMERIPGDWDADMICYPHIFLCENRVFLLYNGNEFGRYGFGLAVLEGT